MAPVEMANPDGIAWKDAASATNLPSGVQLARLSGNDAAGLRNVLGTFSPGYVEPRHTHGIEHATFLLAGRWILEGKEISPGGYMFGPSGLPHGPMESPDGTKIFGSDLGTDFWHAHPPTAEQEAMAVDNIILDPAEVEWQSCPPGFGWPETVEVKVYHVNDDNGRFDCLLRLTPGVSIPLGSLGERFHSVVVLSGSVLVDERMLGVDGHVFIQPGHDGGHLTTEDGATLCLSSLPRDARAISHIPAASEGGL